MRTLSLMSSRRPLVRVVMLTPTRTSLSSLATPTSIATVHPAFLRSSVPGRPDSSTPGMAATLTIRPPIFSRFALIISMTSSICWSPGAGLVFSLIVMFPSAWLASGGGVVVVTCGGSRTHTPRFRARRGGSAVELRGSWRSAANDEADVAGVWLRHGDALALADVDVEAHPRAVAHEDRAAFHLSGAPVVAVRDGDPLAGAARADASERCVEVRVERVGGAVELHLRGIEPLRAHSDDGVEDGEVDHDRRPGRGLRQLGPTTRVSPWRRRCFTTPRMVRSATTWPYRMALSRRRAALRARMRPICALRKASTRRRLMLQR